MPSLYRRSAARIIAVLAAALAATALTGVPALASTPANSPEYPYASTDYSEAARGQFHFSTQSGQMNDINGPIYYRGVYHMFYQSNPHSLVGVGTGAHWGHVTSTDLVHWRQAPIALDPQVQQVASSQLWSGSAWVDTNNVSGLKSGSDDPILMYTNVNGVSIAYSIDGARTFRMYNGGAKVISTTGDSRDPKVQWDPVGNRWVLVLFDVSDSNGASFYTSTNLLSWTKVGHLAASWFSECPDLYRLPVDGNSGQQKWVLQDAGGRYEIGTLDASSMFVADPGWTTPQQMDQGSNVFGGTWYASQTFNQLANNRVVQVGWQGSNQGTTWNGGASFAVEVGLKTFPEGVRVTRNPVSEISSIRSSTRSWGTTTVGTDQSSNPLAGTSGTAYEINADFAVSGASASAFGFNLHQRSDGSSDKTVEYSLANQTLYGKAMAPLSGHVKVHLLVDRDQLEVYGNDGEMVVTDVVHWNPAASSQGISLYATGGTVTLSSLTYSPLSSIWSATPGGIVDNNAVALAVDQSHCLDRDTSSGKVQLWSCLGSTNQSYELNSSGTLTNGGLCVTPTGGGTANQTLITAVSCTGAAAQKWHTATLGHLVNDSSGRCLDLPSGDTTNGNQLQLYDCFSSPAQSWTSPALTGSIGLAGSAKCLDLAVSSGAAQLWDCLGSPNQNWVIGADGTIRGQNNTCLEIPVGQTDNNTLVDAGSCTGATNQKWWRSAHGWLINLASTRCLDLPSGNTANGQRLQVYDCVVTTAQNWRTGPA